MDTENGVEKRINEANRIFQEEQEKQQKLSYKIRHLFAIMTFWVPFMILMSLADSLPYMSLLILCIFGIVITASTIALHLLFFSYILAIPLAYMLSSLITYLGFYFMACLSKPKSE